MLKALDNEALRGQLKTVFAIQEDSDVKAAAVRTHRP